MWWTKWQLKNPPLVAHVVDKVATKIPPPLVAHVVDKVGTKEPSPGGTCGGQSAN